MKAPICRLTAVASLTLAMIGIGAAFQAAQQTEITYAIKPLSTLDGSSNRGNGINKRDLVSRFSTLANGTAGKQESEPNCKPVHADLVEDGVTAGCKPGHSSCFLGEVDGNHGLRGTTYFRADSVATGPSTSPGFISYSGMFEYSTDRGTISARETGVTGAVAGASRRAVTAYQQIISGTGEYAGFSGYFFVSGFNDNQHVVTRMTGELCRP